MSAASSTLQPEGSSELIQEHAGALAQLEQRATRERRRGWLLFWIFTSYGADVGVIAVFAASGVVASFAWLAYALGAGTVLVLMVVWGAALRSRPAMRRSFDRTIRVLAVGWQLGFAFAHPPLAFYCLGVVMIILGFTHKRPHVSWQQAVLEWVLVAAASVALVGVRGMAVLPPLHVPGGGWLVGAAVAVTMARATLFGYWSNQLRGELLHVKELYRSLNAALEQQVARRTRELELRNADLEQANARLHDVASAVAHDLRQPIITISGQASVLRIRLRAGTAAPLQAERILAAAAGMDRICDGLLRLIELEMSDLRPRTLDVTAMAGLVCEGLERKHPQQPVRWTVQAGLSLRADSRLLRMLLEIVLENAWTHTAQTADPAVTVVGGSGVLEVQDNGCGFEPASAERLFEPFRRIHADPAYRGLGINLALARTIARRHGGSLHAQANPSGGASLRLSLPP